MKLTTWLCSTPSKTCARAMTALPLLALTACQLAQDEAWRAAALTTGKPGLWSKNHLTWQVASSSLPAGVNESEVRAVLARSFADWQNSGLFTFAETPAGTAADITISFTPPEGQVFDGPKGQVAWASYPWSQKPGRIHLDPSESWSTTATIEPGRPSLAEWLPRQIGRVLGLQPVQGFQSTPMLATTDPVPSAESIDALRTSYSLVNDTTYLNSGRPMPWEAPIPWTPLPVVRSSAQ